MKTTRTRKAILMASAIALLGLSTTAINATIANLDNTGKTVINRATESSEEQDETVSYTKMSVTNNTAESVDVYIVFAAANSSNSCCPSPAKPSDFSFLKPIKGNPLLSTFNLAAGATQEFDPKGNCFSGNFGFYIEPQCEVKGASFQNGKSGTSIGEFTLNPGTCDEAFDISLVNGINCYLKVDVDSGLGWKYGPSKTAVTSIANKAMNSNSGNPGVYPVNCTDCIKLVGAKPCKGLALGKAQTKRICNVQRTKRGGTVRLSLEKPPK